MLVIDPKFLLGSLLLALALDALLGDPGWLWRRLPHPVVVMGRAIGWLEERWLDGGALGIVQARRGRTASLLVIGASTLVALAMQSLCVIAPLGWLLLAFAMSTLIAARGLYEHVAAVAGGLEQGLEEGRRAVAHIVGRDPASLDAHGVARAAIESTAENFADGVVAPVFWGVLFGLPGMAAYKAINTLDSMIGHRSPRYRHFGRFAARLDDLANWLPARLAAFLILAAALCLPGTTPADGWRALRDAPRHRSPNAGWPEAAIAGSLGLRLAGPRRYAAETVDDAWMGAGRAAATSTDIRRALRVLIGATGGVALLVALVLLGLLGWRSGSPEHVADDKDQAGLPQNLSEHQTNHPFTDFGLPPFEHQFDFCPRTLDGQLDEFVCGQRFGYLVLDDFRNTRCLLRGEADFFEATDSCCVHDTFLLLHIRDCASASRPARSA